MLNTNKMLVPHTGAAKLDVCSAKLRQRINIPFNYRIIKRGALKFIANYAGKIVSNGYHEFKFFKFGKLHCFSGILGAMTVILKVPVNPDDFLLPSNEFHDLSFNKDLGLFLIKTGAMSYILNPITGKAFSKGYHDIFRNAGGDLMGRTGAHEEVILRKKDPEQRLLISGKPLLQL
jgi:hypothetical protein